MEGQWSRTFDIFVVGREEEQERRLMDGACDSLGQRPWVLAAVASCMGMEDAAFAIK